MKAPANVALEDAPTLALSGNAPLSALFANVSSLQLLSSAPKWRVFHAPEWRNCCEQPMRARMARRVRATSLAQRVLERVRANSMAQLMRARMARRALGAAYTVMEWQRWLRLHHARTAWRARLARLSRTPKWRGVPIGTTLVDSCRVHYVQVLSASVVELHAR